jgi:hypothetical protein
MSTSNIQPGYGAVPPPYLASVGAAGQILTASGLNGSSWSQSLSPNAIQIGNSDPVITFAVDGTITTKAGSITAEDWVSVIKVMKQLIMDMSKDEELASKYPYIQEAAHTWFMQELKGSKE